MTNNKHKEIMERVLIGIDKTENEHPNGWWETSTGVVFGLDKKQEILSTLSSALTEQLDEIERWAIDWKNYYTNTPQKKHEYEKLIVYLWVKKEEINNNK